MTAAQQADLPKANFSNLIDAIDFRRKCPICTASLLADSNIGLIRDHETNLFVIRNASNSSDQLIIKKDGKTADLISTDTLMGRNGYFHFPLRMICGHCGHYSHNFKLIVNMFKQENNIEEVNLTTVTLRLSKIDNIILKSMYDQKKSFVIFNDKQYEIDFLDFDPSQQRELYNRFSVMVPFI